MTLGTQLIAYGANCLYIESQPSGTAQALSTFDPNFLNIAAGAIYIGDLRIPLVVIYFLVLALIVWVIWNKTKLGKNMFAVGANTGLNYETDAISAVVVGGVSFSGGVGTIQGVVIGAVIIV